MPCIPPVRHGDIFGMKINASIFAALHTPLRRSLRPADGIAAFESVMLGHRNGHTESTALNDPVGFTPSSLIQTFFDLRLGISE